MAKVPLINRLIEYSDVSVSTQGAIMAAYPPCDNRRRQCDAVCGVWFCTRIHKHEGPHVAVGGLVFCAAWPNDYEIGSELLGCDLAELLAAEIMREHLSPRPCLCEQEMENGACIDVSEWLRREALKARIELAEGR